MTSSSDEDRNLIFRSRDIKYIDDVTGFQCVRCDKVLIRHYISNCGHKFCSNCRKILDDGSKRWRCPIKECNKFIEDIHLQDFYFQETVFDLNAHCPNHKYGCPIIGPLKDIEVHLKQCADTREAALPIELDESDVTHEAKFNGKLLETMSLELKEMKTSLSQMMEEKREEKLTREKQWAEVELNNEKNNELIQRLKNDLKQSESEMKSLKLTMNEVLLERKNKDLGSGLSQDLQSDLLNQVNEEFAEMKRSISELKEEEKLSQHRKWAEVDKRWAEIESTNRENNASLQLFKDELKTFTESALGKLQQAIKARAESEWTASEYGFSGDLRADLLNQMEMKLQMMQISISELKDEKMAQEMKWEEVDIRLNSMVSYLDQVSKTQTQNSEVKDERTSESESQFSDKLMTELKKKLNETEGEKSRVKSPPNHKIYNNLIKPELQHLRRVSEYYEESPNFVWKITNIKSLINGKPEEAFSQVFPLTGYAFQAQAHLKVYGNAVWFSLAFKHPDKARKLIEVKPIPNLYFTLKNRSLNNKDVICTHYFTFADDDEYKYHTFYKFDQQNVNKRALNSSSTYNVDDNVLVNIHVESPEVARAVYAYDGKLSWAIEEFGKRKEMETEGLIKSYLSPYFYTGSKGYRVRAEVWLNGYGEYRNKGLSVYIEFLTGVNDDALTKSFKHRSRVSLFHPKKSDKRVSKISECKGYVGWYAIDMGSHEEIEESLDNDTLYYTVEVEKVVDSS